MLLDEKERNSEQINVFVTTWINSQEQQIVG